MVKIGAKMAQKYKKKPKQVDSISTSFFLPFSHFLGAFIGCFPTCNDVARRPTCSKRLTLRQSHLATTVSAAGWVPSSLGPFG